jgi:hypothetical protein
MWTWPTSPQMLSSVRSPAASKPVAAPRCPRDDGAREPADAPTSAGLRPARSDVPMLIRAGPRHVGTTRPAAAAAKFRRPAPATDARTPANTTRAPGRPAPSPRRTRHRQAQQQRAERQQQAENSSTASTGSRAKVVVTTRNSLVNTPNGGRSGDRRDAGDQQPAEKRVRCRQSRPSPPSVASPSPGPHARR